MTSLGKKEHRRDNNNNPTTLAKVIVDRDTASHGNMAELPSLVRVKRKRGEEPTADLFLEERTLKKQQVWQFRLQQAHPSQLPSDTSNGGVSSGAADHFQQEQQQQRQQLQQDALVRREFRLARPTRPLHRRIESVKKRKAQLDTHDHDIPTFVEATPKRRRVGQEDAPQSVLDTPVSTPTTLKRPGASSRLKKPTAEALFRSPANPPPDRLADALHRFALEEEAREEARVKPKVTSIPKKPVQRYRERHPEQFAAPVQTIHKTEEDVDMMSDDDDYVYDTYVRTKDPVVPANLESEDASNIQVGYIVISEEDQPLWETYFEDEAESDKEFETDDEDENGKHLNRPPNFSNLKTDT